MKRKVSEANSVRSTADLTTFRAYKIISSESSSASLRYADNTTPSVSYRTPNGVRKQ